MPGTAWCSLEDLYGVWPTARTIVDDWRGGLPESGQLWMLMHAAQEQCEAFAPALIPDEDGQVTIPMSYRVAVAMQTRNLYNAAKTDPSFTSMGEGEYAIPVYPLDRVVKQQLRPKTGRPALG